MNIGFPCRFQFDYLAEVLATARWESMMHIRLEQSIERRRERAFFPSMANPLPLGERFPKQLNWTPWKGARQSHAGFIAQCLSKIINFQAQNKKVTKL